MFDTTKLEWVSHSMCQTYRTKSRPPTATAFGNRWVCLKIGGLLKWVVYVCSSLKSQKTTWLRVLWIAPVFPLVLLVIPWMAELHQRSETLVSDVSPTYISTNDGFQPWFLRWREVDFATIHSMLEMVRSFFLGVDSNSILFHHTSLPKPDLFPTWVFD